MIETPIRPELPVAAPDGAASLSVEDPFVRRFLRVATHVRAYAGHYAALAAVLLLVALMHPFGAGQGPVSTAFSGSNAGVVGSRAPAAASAVGVTPGAADATAPSTGALDTLAAPTFSSPSTSSSSSFASSDSTSTASSSSGAVDDSPAAVSSSAGTPTTAPVVYSADGTLTITASGYAAAANGNPNIPANGLPVGVAGTSPTYESFIKLTGNGTHLHLGLVADNGANVGDSIAKMTICPITDKAWKPTRDAAMADAPKFSPQCSPGFRYPDGTWLFDLGPFDEANVPGYAIIPTADAQAFQATFDMKALPPVKA